MGLIEKNGTRICDYCLIKIDGPYHECCGFDLCPDDYRLHCLEVHHNGQVQYDE